MIHEMKHTLRTRAGAPWLRRRSRRAALAAAVVLASGIAACDPGEILLVEDPDIINPADVQSPAGANAVRLGALARLIAATSGGTAGGDNIFLLGGMFADEWINGDSFIYRWEIDQRTMTSDNSFLSGTNRSLHRARVGAAQAAELMAEYNSTAPGWQAAEMHFVQAYTVNILAEHFCSGLVFSEVVDGQVQLGSPETTAAAFERALAHANAGLAVATGAPAADSARVRHALQVVRGRILLNLNRPADAAAAVAGVPTAFAYQTRHSATTESNYIWLRNIQERRYSVGNNEGGNGLNFATANDPRLPVTASGVRDDQGTPMHRQGLWPARETSVTIVGGVEARLIEAEAQLRAGGAAAALLTLNATRRAFFTAAQLPDLTLATTEAGRVDQLFRERAFWLFGRGHRTGDLRRLIRQYGRSPNTVFPTGTWHKNGSQYGPDVTMPNPSAELNNPNVQQLCIDRNA
jgi:hypothetical protein